MEKKNTDVDFFTVIRKFSFLFYFDLKKKSFDGRMIRWLVGHLTLYSDALNEFFHSKNLAWAATSVKKLTFEDIVLSSLSQKLGNKT